MLSAITEFTLPAGHRSAGGLTVGPDGNLWFTDGSEIGRITTAGALTEFRPPSGDAPSGALTLGPDGNLWLAEESPDGSTPGRIGKIDLAPRVTNVVAAVDSQGTINSILVSFDKAMEPASAGKIRFYGLATGVKRKHTIVYSKRVKIAGLSYDPTAHAVRLKLAAPQKAPVQVSVRAGIVAADGMSSSSNFTAVVM